MTFDIVALCQRRPDPEISVAALRDAGRDLRVETVERAKLVQLYHLAGRLLLTTDLGRLVQVRGEVRRLLGIEREVSDPVWWVESRAPAGDSEAEATARRFTAALVARTGGLSWSNR